jgi:DNA-binding winged helix-turn-helix (wHTH) protein
VDTTQPGPILRFGAFELDTAAEQLFKGGRTIRLQPQPFKLLRLLAGVSGRVVTRDEIQAVLWKGDTFVDFEQGVNFAVKQVREALGDVAENPVYIQTVPKRGYRFLAPVEIVTPSVAPEPPPSRRTDLTLHKALWANIAELRLIEERRTKHRKIALAVALAVAVVALVTWLVIRVL